jgi:hypothetical protein
LRWLEGAHASPASIGGETGRAGDAGPGLGEGAGAACSGSMKTRGSFFPRVFFARFRRRQKKRSPSCHDRRGESSFGASTIRK